MTYVFLSTGQSNMVRCEPFLEAAIKAAYGNDSLLIRAAWPGSPVEWWIPGGKAYEDAVLKLDIARQQGFIPRAVCWNQGEANTHAGGAGIGWSGFFTAFTTAICAEIGANVPIIHSILGPKPTNELDQNGNEIQRPNWGVIHDAQRDYGGLAVGQWDIPRLPGNVHYAPETYRDYHTPRYMAHLLKQVPPTILTT